MSLKIITITIITVIIIIMIIIVANLLSVFNVTGSVPIICPSLLGFVCLSVCPAVDIKPRLYLDNYGLDFDETW